MFNTAWAGSRTLNQLVRRRCESCDGDVLTYTAASSDPGVAEVAVSGASVTVMGVSAGTASLTLTDPKRLSALKSFPVTVELGYPGHVRTHAAGPGRDRAGIRSCGPLIRLRSKSTVPCGNGRSATRASGADDSLVTCATVTCWDGSVAIAFLPPTSR